ncbi:glycosyl transferase [Desulfurobacterium atlanticum]|uniref:Glucosyl-3-phosphoglycerate synthase n=1 Tax=Desulfurobacterium atlanticum TaxID=240169 RepID=A0A239A5J5_9BACT|nr:glycosyl transferase [Desulfurobacterium atlanticum]SNR90779.1 glucosyl-3-phosphoglycerate synthase [Desulfurobacterium atlanticum]
MADFFQNGIITTITKLKERPVEEIEAEIQKQMEIARRKLALILPALYSEFEREAVYTILEELKKATYIDKIVLSLDKADFEQFKKVKSIVSELPQESVVIWQDSPEIKKLYKELEEAGFPVDIRGKGRAVWLSIGYVLSDKDVYAMALHDCDIVNYTREIPARLFYPIVLSSLNYEFSKGFYARVHDKLYGRVTRLFFTPLIKALKLMDGKYNEFLEYLDSFRYPLSGEFAMLRSLARGLKISSTWGLEVSILSKVYGVTSVERICQVEIVENYEHKHQKIKRSVKEGLGKMANDIAKTLFLCLSESGLVLSEAFFRTLLTTYLKEAARAIERYNAVALLNGLPYDRHSEIEAVEIFVDAIKNAEAEFIDDPIDIPFLPAWTRVRAAIPDFVDRLKAAVEYENEKV